MHKTTSALAYYGGKASSGNNRGTGRFVANLIPATTKCLYVKTHAGMLGVLLSRQPSAQELVNDLDNDVYNFWKVLRERWDELERVVRLTPYHRTEFDHAVATLSEGDDLERARKLYVKVSMSMHHGTGNAGGMSLMYDASKTSGRRGIFANRIDALRQRVERTQFECRPAVEILDRIKDLEYAVVYVDPPYLSVKSTDTYAVVQHDYDETLDLLRRQRGRVAVSGYNDDWDALLDDGWLRHELDTFTNTSTDAGVSVRLDRVEVCWTNYKPEVQQVSLL